MMRREIYLCDDLVIEIVSWLPVKSLMRFMCASKSFQFLISHPSFVKLHLERSPKNANFLLRYSNSTLPYPSLLPCHVSSLLDNPSSHIALDPTLGFDLDVYEVVGTCNGLVCLVSEFNDYVPCVFCFWNPATRKLIFGDRQRSLLLPQSDNDLITMFGFGYDTLSDTYKVVALLPTLNFEDYSLKSCDVKVCTLSDNNGWRNIQCFPADPVATMQVCGVYLKSTLNWTALAIPHNHPNYYENDVLDAAFDEFVIVSLHLGNETYTQFSLPFGLDDLQSKEVPTIGVLNDFLSLYFHNPKTNHFAIWQMNEFGNQNSWTPLLNIPISNLQFGSMLHCLQPLCIFENARVLMIHRYTHAHPLQAIFYTGRDNKVERRQISGDILLVYNMDYVQSLVSP